ncbi:MAG: hypothetical protein ABIO48_11595 [Pedococcus sp.]
MTGRAVRTTPPHRYAAVPDWGTAAYLVLRLVASGQVDGDLRG